VGVTGRVEGDVIETTDLFVRHGGRLERGDGFPPRPERYETAGVDLIRTLGRVGPAVLAREA
jgi:pilus assembly protein CpaF